MALSRISRLPSDLLDLILFRLPVADYVRSGAVCRFLRQTTAGKPHRPNPKSPLLMFPDVEEGSDDPDSFTIFSIAADVTRRRVRLPQIRWKRIVGSSDGSIIAASTAEVLLLDPLTGTEVRFPPLICDLAVEPVYPFIEKLLFSPSESVAIALSVELPFHYLSFARVGDETWTLLRKEPSYYVFCDAIIHRGEFYVVEYDGSILSFDPTEGKWSTHHGYLLESPFNAKDWSQDIDDRQDVRMFLVESLDGDHLVLVCWILFEESFKVYRQDKIVGGSGEPRRGRNIHLSRSIDKTKLLVEVGSLGEVAIFIGTNCSTCVFTRGLSELKGNCIYFTGHVSFPCYRDGFGVFDLGDGSIQQLVTLQHIPLGWFPPFWIMPSTS